jgi:hypothetical protein
MFKTIKPSIRSIYTKPRSPYLASRNVVHHAGVVPNCENCKNSLKENGELVCKYFKYSTVIFDDTKFHYYMHTTDCRSSPDLCGEEGKFFKPKEL